VCAPARGNIMETGRKEMGEELLKEKKTVIVTTRFE
jgi:hypothetical protein